MQKKITSPNNWRETVTHSFEMFDEAGVKHMEIERAVVNYAIHKKFNNEL